MCDQGGQYAYPPHVRWSIAQEDAGGYLAAADFIHEQGFDVVSLQHEFGIYGGEAGDYILSLISALRIPQQAKEELGFSGHRIVLTFGLISPNKGIETMIAAMPVVLAAAPDTVYVVMRATHPTLLREAGEAYRESLIALVHNLGLERHVVFLNHFVDRSELLQHIAMCDVYVTPYMIET